MSNFEGLQDAADAWASIRSQLACDAVDTCQRPTVFISGKPISERYIGLVSTSIYQHKAGAQASVAEYATAMTDPGSTLFRRSLAGAAYAGLLRVSAESRLSEPGSTA